MPIQRLDGHRIKVRPARRRWYVRAWFNWPLVLGAIIGIFVLHGLWVLIRGALRWMGW